MTDAETALWWRLRHRQLNGHRFRQQVPIGPYIADFACLAARLVVEVDGGQHIDDADRDERRTAWLEERGYRVLRFWNTDVLTNIEAVLETMLRALPAAPPPRPSPARGEGAEPLPLIRGLRPGTVLRPTFENVYVSPEGVIVRVSDGAVSHVAFNGPVDVRQRDGMVTIRVGDVVVEFGAG